MTSSRDDDDKNTKQVSWQERLFQNASDQPKNTLQPEYQQLKFTLHRKLLDRINMDALSTIDNELVRSEVRNALNSLIHAEPTMLTSLEKQQISDEVLN